MSAGTSQRPKFGGNFSPGMDSNVPCADRRDCYVFLEDLLCGTSELHCVQLIFECYK